MMTYDRLIEIIKTSDIGLRQYTEHETVNPDVMTPSDVEDLARRIWREMEPGQPS